MTAFYASQETSSEEGKNTSHGKVVVQQEVVSTLHDGSGSEESVSLPKSADLPTILSNWNAKESIINPTPRGSGQSTPTIISEDDEAETAPVGLKPLVRSSAIRMSSMLVKPRVVSAVSSKAIFKEAYTGSKKKVQQPKTNIGFPLPVPPRLPSVGAGKVIVNKSSKR